MFAAADRSVCLSCPASSRDFFATASRRRAQTPLLSRGTRPRTRSCLSFSRPVSCGYGADFSRLLREQLYRCSRGVVALVVSRTRSCASYVDPPAISRSCKCLNCELCVRLCHMYRAEASQVSSVMAHAAAVIIRSTRATANLRFVRVSTALLVFSFPARIFDISEENNSRVQFTLFTI